MEEIRISAEQFRRELTELLSQAGYGGASVVVERHGTPLAALIPYQEYQKRALASEESDTKSSTPEKMTQEDLVDGSSSQENSTVLRKATVAYNARPIPMTTGVLTIEETAAYLRISLDTVKSQAEQGEIPARKLGDSWRFLRTALDQWLQPQNSGSALLAQAGIFAGDRSLDEILSAIYTQRGRPELDSEKDNDGNREEVREKKM